ncbi:Peptidyl-prolyl cis-trans isomerase [Hondaea fermentalgiana]|uniref:peptidylprolyl isomerase n=1 Tax=Hondaea fermentalgiana TaxID=2315210 RepID=A0A2R5GQ55_9STRA|nr:Peptidyl-prolyl cis-trans isomerase [Hondaea fermentalgiana]|eukprot:GBG30481.1 Peptidyl-prolyl cis-trans isomerase [Hondaea fermentalgiana]
MQFARALYTFVAAQEGDLGFEENDVLVVEEQDSSGWWVGEDQTTGARGEFPYNYVELISEDEAQRLMAAKDAPKQFKFDGDRIATAKVFRTHTSARTGEPKFDIRAMTSSGKKRVATKSISQIRELDVQVKSIFPTFDGVLPPRWADHAGLEGIDVDKREESIEIYLNMLTKEDTTSYLLMVWLFPGEQVDVQAASDEIYSAAEASASAGQDRESVRAPEDDGLTNMQLAHVEFTWTPQDDVELFMESSQVIAILSQSTGSPGWWEAQTVGGSKGLIPYNHVELLDSRVAHAILTGTPLTDAQAMQFDEAPAGGYAETKRVEKKRTSLRKSLSRLSLGRRKSKEATPSAFAPPPAAAEISKRERRVISSFQLSSIESFDRLIDNGYTMEEGNRTIGQSLAPDGPQQGDFVQLSYAAYIWDEQHQSLIEFGATDLPSKLSPEGGSMEFFVGGGEVIRGVEYAVQRMNLGQNVRLVVNPALAYGKVGLPPDVPPNSHVVFDLTLDAFGSDGKPMPKQLEVDVPPPPDIDDGNHFFEIEDDEDDPVIMASNTRGGGRSPHKPPVPRLTKPQLPKQPKMPQAASKPVAVSKPFAREFDRASARPSPSQTAKGFKAPAGKPISLQEAIAQRRAKLEHSAAQPAARPVADHVSRRIPAGAAWARPAPPKVTYLKPEGQFSLDELREAVRNKALEDLQVDPSVIEDYISDEDFEYAFKMSRGEFLLKPKWRQQALRKGAGLF